MLPRLLASIIYVLLPLAHPTGVAEGEHNSPELHARQHGSSTAEHQAAAGPKSGGEGGGGGLSSTALISIGAGISAFVVIWETITAMEKGAAPIESWSGRVENFDTVIDVRNRKKRRMEEMAMGKDVVAVE